MDQNSVLWFCGLRELRNVAFLCDEEENKMFSWPQNTVLSILVEKKRCAVGEGGDMHLQQTVAQWK